MSIHHSEIELHLLWDKYPMIPSNSQSSGIALYTPMARKML